MSSLHELFLGITPSRTPAAVGETISGVRLPGLPGRHIGRDENDHPVVLLQVNPTERLVPGIVLQNLRVEHGVQCRVTCPDGQFVDGCFSVIRCLSNDASLHQYFLCVMESLLASLPIELTSDRVSCAVDQLSTLFLALQRPPTKSVRGLWGELFLIAHAEDPTLLVEAWHSRSDERFDFSMGNEHLEVKSSGSRDRIHHFTLAQAHPSLGSRAYVASICVESETGGLSLGDLWDSAREFAANPSMRLKVDQVCVGAVGDNWEAARACTFNKGAAGESLAYYDVADIPVVPVYLPAGVSDVRFTSDLSHAIPVSAEVRTRSSLLKACPKTV